MVKRRQGNKVTAYRRNPYLYVYNPGPIKGRGIDVGEIGVSLRVQIQGVIGLELHDIRYTHAEDYKPYEHVFDSKVRAYAGVDDRGRAVVILIGADGQNVWEDR